MMPAERVCVLLAVTILRNILDSMFIFPIKRKGSYDVSGAIIS